MLQARDSLVTGLGAATTAVGALTSRATDFLKDYGVSRDQVLEAAGLTLADLERRRSRMPLEEFSRFLEAAAKVTGDQGFGIRFGQHVPVGVTGVLSFTILYARNLDQGLQMMARYASTVLPVRDASFGVDDGLAWIRWHWSETLSPRAQLSDFSASIVCSRIRLAAGDDWLPAGVVLDRTPPQRLDAHHSAFGQQIAFNEAVTGIALRTRDLELPMPDSDPNLFAILSDYCDVALQRVQETSDPLFDIRQGIIDLLPAQKATLDAVAQKLGVPSGAIRQRLKSNGTGFNELLEDIRPALARRYLGDRDLTLTEIALRLGYSELSAFSRASQRWFGCGPRDYREQVGLTGQVIEN